MYIAPLLPWEEKDILKSQWLRPRQGYAKINTDGAFARSLDKSAAAAICRYGSGAYLGASALVINGISDPAAPFRLHLNLSGPYVSCTEVRR